MESHASSGKLDHSQNVVSAPAHLGQMMHWEGANYSPGLWRTGTQFKVGVRGIVPLYYE